MIAARSGKRVGGLRSRGSHAPADFFPRNLTHTKGPAAGRAFALDPGSAASSTTSTRWMSAERGSSSAVVFEYARWVAPDVERWVPADVREGLTGREFDQPDDTIAIGGDGSRSYDASALAWAQRALDGRIDVTCRVLPSLPPEQPSDDGAEELARRAAAIAAMLAYEAAMVAGPSAFILL